MIRPVTNYCKECERLRAMMEAMKRSLLASNNYIIALEKQLEEKEGVISTFTGMEG